MRRGETIVFAALIVILSTALAGAQAQEKDENGFWVTSAIGMDLKWKVEGEWLDVSVSAPTTGWVAVGFNPTGKMKNANIIIGYVQNGEVFMRDDFGSTLTRHQADADIGGSLDIGEPSGSESNGKTEISFRIKLDSGDAKDRPLEAGKTYRVILAHGEDGADNFGAYHGGKRTTIKITL